MSESTEYRCGWCGTELDEGDPGPWHKDCQTQADAADHLRREIVDALMIMQEAVMDYPEAQGCRLGDDCRELVKNAREQAVKVWILPSGKRGRS